MTDMDIDNIRILSAKKRLSRENLIDFSMEEKKQLEHYKDIFDKFPETASKKIMYMHDFMGIEFDIISFLIDKDYQCTRNLYYKIKSVFLTY